MNYQQTLDYLYSRLPMYQRIGKAAYKADIESTVQLCNKLGNPHEKFKSIHIAGTNGKGSVSHMIASVLQESGLKTGLYTSPHLKDFRERIKVNGNMIPEQVVSTFVNDYKADFEKIELSFFEWTVGLAFWYFEKENIDVAVIETGMGGRLDSTNVITPVLSVITNIGLDHTQFLGDTRALIAQEKAGIIKKTVPVVIGEADQEILDIFTNKSALENAPIHFADATAEHDYSTDLKGSYQSKNIRTALAALSALNEVFPIKEQNKRKGLENVVKNTGLIGRWQILSKTPLVVCDTGHNKEAMVYLMEQIRAKPCKNLHIVLGVVNDKSPQGLLELLPDDATYYYCKANIPRALDADKLKQEGNKAGLKGDVFSSVKKAYDAALANAGKEDMIFIGGSTFVVAEVV